MNEYFAELVSSRSTALFFAIIVAIAGVVACGCSSENGGDTAGGGPDAAALVAHALDEADVRRDEGQVLHQFRFEPNALLLRL